MDSSLKINNKYHLPPKEIYNFKTIPSKNISYIGFLDKRSKNGVIMKTNFVELDFIKGIINIYESIVNFPNFISSEINILNISSCIMDRSISKLMYSLNIVFKEYNLTFGNKITFWSPNPKSILKWVEFINYSISSHSHMKNLIESNNEYKGIINSRPKSLSYINFNDKIDNIYECFKKKYIDESILNKINKSKELSNDSVLSNMSNTTNKTESSRKKNPNYKEEKNILEIDATLLFKITKSSFHVMNSIGNGSFGKVFKVKYRADGCEYAMKVLKKSALQKNKILKYAYNECNILHKLNHPYIIKLYYSFEDENYLYMIIDLCTAGDLSSYISKMLFEEEEAKFFIAELILSIEYIHKLGYIHRDLKPENLLIDSKGHIKLTDFGLVDENDKSQLSMTICGSIPYLAPEMVKEEGVNHSADLYAIGVILYEMIFGTTPFYNDNITNLYDNIVNKDINFKSNDNEISHDLKGLLKVCRYI